MAKISVQNLEGKKVEEINISDSVFNVPLNRDLLHQVYVSIDANKRQVIAHTKDRSERQGSGKKPWKQKGTGNARFGDRQVPIWRGGGVTFGPTKNRNFKKSLNSKMKRKAVMIVLSEKLRSNTLLVIDEMKLKENKTKDFSKALTDLKIDGSVLVGFGEKERDLRIFSRNIDKVSNILAENLNAYDLLNSKFVLLSKDSIKLIEEKFENKK